MVLHAEPTVLLVGATIKGFNIDILVAHAPVSKKGSAAKLRWWQSLSDLLRSSGAGSRPMVIMIDSNSRVGSITSPSVGGRWPQEQDQSGGLLHALLGEFGLAMPQTFHGNMQGPHDATWTSRLLGQHRIDFVAIPLSWLPDARAEVCEEVDVSAGAQDHRLVVVDCKAEVRRQQDVVFRRRPRCDRNLLQHPIRAEVVRVALSSARSLPWGGCMLPTTWSSPIVLCERSPTPAPLSAS